MTKSSPPGKSVLGIDVAQDSVTVFDAATGNLFTIPNTRKALRAALLPLRNRALAVCETTGGHEDRTLAVLLALAIPAHRADAAKVAAFIRSFGKRAKTDAVDARWLAHYGQERFEALERWQASEPDEDRLKALVGRRRDLVAMRAAEMNRLKAPRADALKVNLKRHVAELNRHIEAIEAEIQVLMQTERFRKRAEALRSVPGIGPAISSLLLAEMPELGRLDRREAASLAACAPHPRDSGKSSAYRKPVGGRRQLRPFLFIAALSAARGTSNLAAKYRAFLANGKAKRVALGAIMRSIIVIANARVRDAITKHHQLT